MTYDSSLDWYVEDYESSLTDDDFSSHCVNKFNAIYNEAYWDHMEMVQYIDQAASQPNFKDLTLLICEEYLEGETGCSYDWFEWYADKDGTVWEIVYCGDGLYPVNVGALPMAPPLHTCAIPPAQKAQLPSSYKSYRKLYNHQRTLRPEGVRWCDWAGNPVISHGDMYEPYPAWRP